MLDINGTKAILHPAHPPSLCFFGSTLNPGGFFLFIRGINEIY